MVTTEEIVEPPVDGAIEASGRDADALERYRRVGAIEADLTWVQAARSRLAELGEDLDDEPWALVAYGDDDDAPDLGEAPTGTDDEAAAWRYDPLSSAYDTRLRSGGPMPTGPPPAAAPTSRLWGASLSLGPFVDDHVVVHAVHGVHGDSAGTTWLERSTPTHRPVFSTR